MPTYSYACKDCGHAFDINQSFSDDALTVCPECGGQLRKKFGSVGVVFKGSGFYKTDSRDSGSKSEAGKGSSTAKSGDAATSSDSGSKSDGGKASGKSESGSSAGTASTPAPSSGSAASSSASKSAAKSA